MARQMNDNFSPDKKKNAYAKFTKPGIYEGTITGCRYTPETLEQGDRYFIDATVDSGPDAELFGKVASWLKFFQLRYKAIRFADGRIFSAAEQEKKDNGRLQVAAAAALGLEAEDAKQLGSNGTHAGFFERIFDGLGGDACVVGRKVRFVVTEGKSGYMDVALEPIGEPVDPTALPKANVPPAPPPPAAPAAAPDVAVLAAKHGFTVHPADASFVFKGSVVLAVSDFVRQYA